MHDILEKTMLKGQEQISGCQSLEGRGRFDYKRDEGLFGGDETILYHDCGGGCMTTVFQL